MSLTSVILKSRTAHTATVIFLHGLGDTGRGWEPVAHQLARLLPHIKFILPNAPIQPITLNHGMSMPAWYDIRSLEDITQMEDEPGMQRSMVQINQLIRSEIDSGIPANRIVLGGFSQGGALALYTGLQLEYRLGGLVVMSGYLPVREQLSKMKTEASSKIPVFQAHGRADDVVMNQFGEMSRRWLEANGNQVEFHGFDHMGHSACEEEIEELGKFLKKYIS